MATAAQIAANRLNAQKSTGPRTPEGKSAARFNALKHGMDAATIVIPGEDPDAYDALAADYYQRFRPQSPIEEFHVDTLIRSDWQKRRLQRAEAKLSCPTRRRFHPRRLRRRHPPRLRSEERRVGKEC